eukprot:jgi/Tetstr1/424926/TSEL_015419.t1
MEVVSARVHETPFARAKSPVSNTGRVRRDQRFGVGPWHNDHDLDGGASIRDNLKNARQARETAPPRTTFAKDVTKDYDCTEATRVRYLAWFAEHGTIGAGSLQPYLSAINTFMRHTGRVDAPLPVQPLST